MEVRMKVGDDESEEEKKIRSKLNFEVVWDYKNRKKVEWKEKLIVKNVCRNLLSQ